MSKVPPNGSTWPGKGDHEGHTITKIAHWNAMIEGAFVTFDDGKTKPIKNATVFFDANGQWERVVSEKAFVSNDDRGITVDGGELTSGKVRCSCGSAWRTGGWPVEELV